MLYVSQGSWDSFSAVPGTLGDYATGRTPLFGLENDNPLKILTSVAMKTALDPQRLVCQQRRLFPSVSGASSTSASASASLSNSSDVCALYERHDQDQDSNGVLEEKRRQWIRETNADVHAPGWIHDGNEVRQSFEQRVQAVDK